MPRRASSAAAIAALSILVMGSPVAGAATTVFRGVGNTGTTTTDSDVTFNVTTDATGAFGVAWTVPYDPANPTYFGSSYGFWTEPVDTTPDPDDLSAPTSYLVPVAPRYFERTAPRMYTSDYPTSNCNRVWIRDYAQDATGKVIRFAADVGIGCSPYELTPDANDPTGVADPGITFARIRHNTTVPLFPDEPMAAIRPFQEREDGETVFLDGRMSLPGADPIVAWNWQQISGIPVQLLDANSSIARFVVPQLPLGGSDVVVRLTVTDAAGRNSSYDQTQHVASKSDARTFVKFTDGAGQSHYYAPFNAVGYSAAGGVNFYAGRVQIELQGTAPPDRFFTLSLGVLGTEVQVPHEYATEPTGSLAGSSARFAESSLCQYAEGTFGLDWVRDQPGSGYDLWLTSATAHFHLRCAAVAGGSTGPWYDGEYRHRSYHAGVPAIPASSQLDAIPGASVPLDLGGVADDGPISALSYAWTQTGGPAVAIIGASSANASFTAPSLAPGSWAELRFSVLITDADGYMTEREVVVRVAGDADVGAFQVPRQGIIPPPDVFGTRHDEWFVVYNDGAVDVMVDVAGNVPAPSAPFRATLADQDCPVAGSTFQCPSLLVPAGFGYYGYIVVDAPHNGTIVVDLTAAGALDDLVPANNAIQLVQAQTADLMLTANVSDLTELSAGGTGTAFFTVGNQAPNPVPQVTVDFTLTGPGAITAASLPNATCTHSAAAAHCAYALYTNPGPGNTIWAAITVRAADGAAGVITLTGHIASPSIEPTPANNTAIHPIAVSAGGGDAGGGGGGGGSTDPMLLLLLLSAGWARVRATRSQQLGRDI